MKVFGTRYRKEREDRPRELLVLSRTRPALGANKLRQSQNQNRLRTSGKNSPTCSAFSQLLLSLEALSEAGTSSSCPVRLIPILKMLSHIIQILANCNNLLEFNLSSIAVRARCLEPVDLVRASLFQETGNEVASRSLPLRLLSIVHRRLEILVLSAATNVFVFVMSNCLTTANRSNS